MSYEEESGMEFYVCGGIVFYIPTDCIIDEVDDSEEGVVKATDAFTVQPNFVTAGNMGHVINMITEFKDVTLIFNGYGAVPKNSEIIKGIRQLRMGVKLVS
jgi:hypothetical protein